MDQITANKLVRVALQPEQTAALAAVFRSAGDLARTVQATKCTTLLEEYADWSQRRPLHSAICRLMYSPVIAKAGFEVIPVSAVSTKTVRLRNETAFFDIARTEHHHAGYQDEMFALNSCMDKAGYIILEYHTPDEFRVDKVRAAVYSAEKKLVYSMALPL